MLPSYEGDSDRGYSEMCVCKCVKSKNQGNQQVHDLYRYHTLYKKFSDYGYVWVHVLHISVKIHFCVITYTNQITVRCIAMHYSDDRTSRQFS